MHKDADERVTMAEFLKVFFDAEKILTQNMEETSNNLVKY